jgi:hypothetical protein
MRNYSAAKPFRALRRGVLAASLAALSSTPVMLPQVAIAIPKSCFIRSYYKTAEMSEAVGMRSSCPGAKRWGRTSRFVEVEWIDLVPEGPSTPGGGGGLPCEFKPDDGQCSNLPNPR